LANMVSFLFASSGISAYVIIQEGRNLAKNLGCAFIETSSEQGINVDEAFYMLVREIRKYSCNADKMESGDMGVTPWSRLKSLVRGVTKSSRP